ncbi:MAG: hypothetical protein R3C97_10450 [Geminicoccaceae bacterium]
MDPGLIFFAGIVLVSLLIWLYSRSGTGSLLYLNEVAATSKRVGRRAVVPEYRDLARFFHSGLIDRTGTLDAGFPCAILHPLPEAGRCRADLATLCERRARSLLDEAGRLDRDIELFWSGGIDSTAALTALLRVAEDDRERQRIEVRYAPCSIAEYPLFFEQFIDGRLRHAPIERSIGEAMDSGRLIVTGELGDQIFGSMLARPHVESGAAFRPWREALPDILRKELGKAHAEKVITYVEPQVEKAPCALDNLFDLLWWMNFSLKWQVVDLRLAVSCGSRAKEVHAATRHFFADRAFEEWAVDNRDLCIAGHWASYKWPLKAFVRDFTGDEDYFANKLKEPSLQKVLGEAASRDVQPQPVAMMQSYGLLVGLGVGLGIVQATGDTKWEVSVSVE